MDTETFKRSALVRHGNKAFNGLSAAAIVWMFATFAQKQDLVRHEDRESATHAKQWQKLMDHEVALARHGFTEFAGSTNDLAVTTTNQNHEE